MGASPWGTAAGAPELTLVRDGRAEAVMVLPASASPAATAGAEILGDYLFQMSGARLAVIPETDLGDAKVQDGRLIPGTPQAVATYVLLGEGELARKLGATSDGLGPGGIRIQTFGNALVLLGADVRTPTDPWGTRYAVTTFLEHPLGCRYLWPGELGMVVPKRKTIQIPHLDERFTPVLKQRSIRDGAGYAGAQDGLERLGYNREEFRALFAEATATRSRNPGWFGWHCLGGSVPIAFGHSFEYAWQKYHKEHPEWFGMQPDGSRDQSHLQPDRSTFCVSNPALIEAIAQDIIEQLNRTGKQTASIGPNDGGMASQCLCPACEALDPPEGRKVQLFAWDAVKGERRHFDHVSLTDRYVYFWNGIAERVAQVHPDALLGADAYAAFTAPPLKRKLHPQIAIRFVPSPGAYMRDSERKQWREEWDGWHKMLSTAILRPNLLLASRREGAPNLYAHKMAEDFRHMARHGMIGTDFDSCLHNWAIHGMNYYIVARLHWNPDLDVDQAMEEYCSAGFEEAGKEIRRYFAGIEERTNRLAAAESSYTAPYEETGDLRACLDAADKAAGEDAIVRRRITFLRRGLDYAEVTARAYRLLNLSSQRALTPEEQADAARLLDERWLLMRRMFHEEPLAVNVAYVCSGIGWTRFAAVGWTEPSPAARATAAAGK